MRDANAERIVRQAMREAAEQNSSWAQRYESALLVESPGGGGLTVIPGYPSALVAYDPHSVNADPDVSAIASMIAEAWPQEPEPEEDAERPQKA